MITLPSSQEIENYLSKLQDSIKSIDMEINLIYHVLEFYKMDAINLTRVNSRLRALLVSRRDIKEKMADVQSIVYNILPGIKKYEKNLNERSKKVYDMTRYDEYLDRLSINATIKE